MLLRVRACCRELWSCITGLLLALELLFFGSKLSVRWVRRVLLANLRDVSLLFVLSVVTRTVLCVRTCTCIPLPTSRAAVVYFAESWRGTNVLTCPGHLLLKRPGRCRANARNAIAITSMLPTAAAILVCFAVFAYSPGLPPLSPLLRHHTSI